MGITFVHFNKIIVMKTLTESFEEFASNGLNIHLKELATSYSNEKPGKDVMQEAYRIHKNLYSAELDEEIEKLVHPGNVWVKGELDNLKNDFLSKLVLTDR